MGDRSVRAGDMRQSVIVTGDGSTVALIFGDTGVRLPLRRSQFRPPERRQRPVAGEMPRELGLLVAEAGKLPLIGRKDLFAELRAWLEDEIEISVHGLIGRAGSGKTRLALELCRTIDSNPLGKSEWIAGFLSPSDLGAVVETLTTHSFKWERRTLLVIDCAAQCHQALARWLDRLADQNLDAKLRILLLDREAPEAFGWWHELTNPALHSERERCKLFYALRPRQLPDLSALEERRALMAAALQAARELRPGAPTNPRIPATDEDADLDRRLAQPQFGNPLNLVMAGVIALDRGPHGALALRRLDAARQLGRRELRRLADLAESRRISSDAMRHIVAFNGLAGGVPVSGLRKIVAGELTASHRSTDELGALLILLQQELPSHTAAAHRPRLATIQPDLIGEAAIIEALTGEPSREAEADDVVRRAYELDREAAAHALVRLVQDFGYALEDPKATDAEKATGQRAMGWLLHLGREVDEPEHLLPLASALPEQTTILREPAAEVTQRLANYFLREAEQSKDPVAHINAAIWLNNLANRLRDLGQLEEALTAVEEAVRLRRALAEARPDAFIPDLALSLNNLATVLSDLGRREEGLAAAEEATRRYRALAEVRPDAFKPYLAMSVNNLANKLSDLGRREQALTTAEEAVRLYRALAEARSEAFTHRLAGSLNNLANRLSALGRREAALATTEEAISLFRALAEARPDAFTSDLARSLTGLAARLGYLGRREDALKAAEEAVSLFRAFAHSRPVFAPSLAGSLNNLANALSSLGRSEQALTVAEEAVGLYRVLAEARPDAFSAELARSLNNLANKLSNLGRREEALTAAEEAVLHRRILARAQPDAFTPDLAASLNNLANALRDLGRREDALTAAEEAVRLYHTLAEARPDAFIPDLALSLNNLANMLRDLGRREDALTPAEQAVRFYRALADSHPDVFTDLLAGSLNNVSAMFSDLGRREEALIANEEAVFLYRGLAGARPDIFTSHLAGSLSNLGGALGDLGRDERALTAAEEAVSLYRALAETRPDAFTPNLATSLQNLANRLSILGQREQALVAAEEAAHLHRALAETHPDPFTADLAGSLNNLANRLSDLGRRGQALMTAEEAVRLYRTLAEARPNVFAVELARSLWVLGEIYAQTGNLELAIKLVRESIDRLAPVFRATPAAVSGMLTGLVQSYLAQCDAAGRDPDAELVRSVVNMLRSAPNLQHLSS